MFLSHEKLFFEIFTNPILKVFEKSRNIQNRLSGRFIHYNVMDESL